MHLSVRSGKRAMDAHDLTRVYAASCRLAKVKR